MNMAIKSVILKHLQVEISGKICQILCKIRYKHIVLSLPCVYTDGDWMKILIVQLYDIIVCTC